MYHTIYVSTGNGVNNNTSQAWIDYNKDGVFDPINERVLLDSLLGLSQTNPAYALACVIEEAIAKDLGRVQWLAKYLVNQLLDISQSGFQVS